MKKMMKCKFNLNAKWPDIFSGSQKIPQVDHDTLSLKLCRFRNRTPAIGERFGSKTQGLPLIKIGSQLDSLINTLESIYISKEVEKILTTTGCTLGRIIHQILTILKGIYSINILNQANFRGAQWLTSQNTTMCSKNGI
jgi:hypothetical protein